MTSRKGMERLTAIGCRYLPADILWQGSPAVGASWEVSAASYVMHLLTCAGGGRKRSRSATMGSAATRLQHDAVLPSDTVGKTNATVCRSMRGRYCTNVALCLYGIRQRHCGRMADERRNSTYAGCSNPHPHVVADMRASVQHGRRPLRCT